MANMSIMVRDRAIGSAVPSDKWPLALPRDLFFGSLHAIGRAEQRGFSDELIAATVAFGRPVAVDAGRTAYLLTEGAQRKMRAAGVDPGRLRGVATVIVDKQRRVRSVVWSEDGDTRRLRRHRL